MTITTFLGILGLLKDVANHPIVRKALENFAAGTANQVDDRVVRSLYELIGDGKRAASNGEMAEEADRQQAWYEALTPDEKAALKGAPSALAMAEELDSPYAAC